MADGDGESEGPPKRFSPFLRQLYPVAGIVLYTIGTGCILGYPAVLLPQLREHSSGFTVDEHSESWIASILGFGILNGVFLLPFIMARCGRKLCNFLSILPVLAGWGFILVADDVPLLLLGRYLKGTGMGIQGSMAPVSIGEYVSPKNRGQFMGSFTFSLASGMLICHACGCYLSWRNTALVSMSFSILSLVIIATSPETPAWLLSKGKIEKCKESFFWLRGYGNKHKEELDEMISKQTMNKEKTATQSKETFSSWFKNLINILKKKEFYKPCAIVLTMFIIMQFSGANVVASYSVTIMKAVAEDTMSPYTGMLVVDFARFIAAVIACFSLRRFNVRTVLFFSSIVSATAVSATASYIYFRDIGYNLSYSWIPITFMFIYVFGMTSGIYAIPFMVLGEVFPLAYKRLGSLFGGIFLSITFFAVIKTSPFMFISIGVHGAFIVFAIMIIISTVVLYFILPETRGKTLQQIEDNFKGIKIIDVQNSPEEDKMMRNKSDAEII